MWKQEAAGSTGAVTIGSTVTLHTVSGAEATYVLYVDTAPMANGDHLELQIKTAVTSGGTQRVLYSAVFAHAQPDPLKVSVPVIGTGADLVFELVQTEGTGRDFTWSVLSQ